MKLLLLNVFACLFGATLLSNSEPSRQGSDKDAAPPKYVGSQACKKCHPDQYKAWKKTRMAKSFELLKPGVSSEAKEKHGLDPKKDYTTDKACLPCHTTGWGKPGGYQIPPTGDSVADKKARKHFALLEGVGCESCHGPASHVIEYKRKNEKYKWADLAKKKLLDGVRFPSKDTCVVCHNEESPFVQKGFVFDYEKLKDEGTHRHFKMDFDHACPHKHSVTKKKKKKRK